MIKAVTLLIVCLFAAAGSGRPVSAQGDHAALLQRIHDYQFGSDPGVVDAANQWINESRMDPAQRKATARALAALLSSDASFAAKQLVCRNLVLIATVDQAPALLKLLPDKRLAHFAMMALTRIPGKVVNSDLRRAAPQTSGPTRIEIDEALGNRRDSLSIPLLSSDISSADPAISAAAAHALAKIGGSHVMALLTSAFARTTGARRVPLGAAMLAAAAQLQGQGDSSSALDAYVTLDHHPATAVQGAAALRGIVQIRGAAAMPLIVAALREDRTPRQAMAAELAREIPGRAATLALSRTLPELSERGQLLLIEALSDRRDPAAAPAVIASAGSKNADIRLAALNALGALGDTSTLPLLLHAAATGSAADQAAARSSLSLLRGAGVDSALLAEVGQGPLPIRVEAINALGQRHVSAALPRLVSVVRTAPPQIRTAALNVLRDMGQPADLPTLVNLLLSTPAGGRDAEIDTISEIARRGATEHDRTAVLLQRFSAAKRPADRVDLLTLLAQVGGPQALTAMRRAEHDPSPEVKFEALRQLTEWPTSAPMEDLLQITRTTLDPKQRTIALRGYLRMVGVDAQRPPDETLALYRSAAPMMKSDAERRVMLAGLAKLHTLAALEYASSFLKDAGVHPEAESAVVEIGSGTIGAWPDKTRTALQPIAADNTNEAIRKRAQDVLAMSKSFGDFDMAWEVSPAYEKNGMDYRGLFDTPFPPEEPAQSAKVNWTLMPVGTNPAQPWLLDLLALWGGEERVAYLRTAVWSDAGRDAVLELGSDDGVKAWLNGKIVLAHNVPRAVAPAEEKVKVALLPGWNQMMLKITQHNQGWGACARFTNTDGSPLKGLRFAAPSSEAVRAQPGAHAVLTPAAALRPSSSVRAPRAPRP